MQAMAQQLGGQVVSGSSREFGYAKATVSQPASRLLAGIEDAVFKDGTAELKVWMSHGDHVEVLPPGFVKLPGQKVVPLSPWQMKIRQFYGVQFHPEVSHTRAGCKNS